MIALADLNEDHWLDLVVLNYGTDSVGIHMASKRWIVRIPNELSHWI